MTSVRAEGRRPEQPPLERIVLGSRRSPLARAQSSWVGHRLREAWPALEVAFRFLDTRGDSMVEQPLPEIGGKGLFTEALEVALEERRIDVAVHSLKDLPTEAAEAFPLVAIPEREDPRDLLVSEEARTLDELPPGTVVGTSSLRRRAQLLRFRPDCRVEPVRGNVQTRLARLVQGRYGALILAAAGLQRLGLRTEDMRALDPPGWLPAPGQGALAVQGRSGEVAVAELLSVLDDPRTRCATEAERALLAALEGGCQVPIGALARDDGSRLVLEAGVFSSDGTSSVLARGIGSRDAPAGLGHEVADRLLARGARELLIASRDA
ncbi:MAG: hydroxymethylbilane synthase [Gemmatimonadota bacterium]